MRASPYDPLRCLMAALICLVLALPEGARADGTLTLQLPPSQAALDARAQAEQTARQARAQSQAAFLQRSRATLPSRGLSSWREPRSLANVIGRLGELVSGASIYRAPSVQSLRLASPPAGTYVAIKDTRGDWRGVLMSDGSIGWAPARRIRLLDYQVVSDGQYSAPTQAEGLPQSADDIYPRSSTPFFTGDAQTLLAEAYRYLGVSYLWGGNTAGGIDCSGLVHNVFASRGFILPRLGSDQMAYGIPVPVDQLQPGDRLYFERRTDRLGVKHTGIYIGNGYFIHSSSSRHGVAINSLTESLWHHIFVCARR